MSAELVLDASVAVKCFVTEQGSAAARQFVLGGASFVAPDHVLTEIASVAVKRMRRGDIPAALAKDMIVASPDLFSELAPASELRLRAFELASVHGASLYDCLYIALAEARSTQVVTADEKLEARFLATPFASLIRRLPETRGA